MNLILPLYLTALVVFLYATPPLQAEGFGIGFDVKGGALYAGIPSLGAEANVRFNRVGLALSVMHGEVSVKNAVQDAADDADDTVIALPSNADVKRAQLTQDIIAADVRFFPMNGSFFFGVGAGTGKLVGDLRIESETSAALIDEKTTVANAFYSLSLGNLWTPGWVSIGAEWFGLTKVASSRSKTESNSTGGADSAMSDGQDDFSDRVKTLGEKGGVSLVIFHLGLAI